MIKKMTMAKLIIQFKFFIAILLFALLPVFSHALTLDTLFMSINLPDSWECKLDNSNWICRKKNKEESKQGLIVITAKQVGPEDSLASYQKHLAQPKQLTLEQQIPVFSKVLKSAKAQIGGQEWIESLHLGSEVENYYSYYFATVKNQTAVLVTLSAHKLYFDRFKNDFLNSMRTAQLKEFYPATTTTSSPGFAEDTAPQPVASHVPKSESRKRLPWLMIIAFVVVTGAFVGFVLKKRR